MTNDDRHEFTKIMFVLAETFKEPMSDLRLEGYWLGLSDLPLDNIRDAAAQAVRACKFFPRPSELREIADGSREDDTEKAWQLYKAEARRIGGYGSPTLDAALAETLVLVFGSWQAACWTDFSPEMWASKRKEFGRSYRILRQRGLKGPTQLAGFFEREGKEISMPLETKQLTEGDDDYAYGDGKENE